MTSLACVRFDKPIVPVKGSHVDGPLQSGAYSGAMVHDLHGGYGSRYDCHAFVVGLCDECVTRLRDRGQIVELERTF